MREDPGLQARTFPTLPSLRSEWNVSPEAFDAFLAWLDPDRETAGKKYEDIRRRLIKMFVCRGCYCSEDLADETLNRVISKVREIKDNYRGDPGCYCGGVARNVFHEYARRKPEPPLQPEPDAPEARARELDCLDKCLGQVTEADHTLILRYYKGEKRSRIRNRNDLARELGKEQNALRIKVYRIRAFLQRCVGDCLLQSAEG